MTEAEESDAISLKISLEFSYKPMEELAASSKANESCPTSHVDMTTDMTATDKSTTQEGPTYGGHAYYKYDDSISTNNTLGEGSYSRYSSSSSNNR